MLNLSLLLYNSKKKTALLLLLGVLLGTANAQLVKGALIRKAGKTNLEKFLNTQTWNELFPNRYGLDKKDGTDRYTTEIIASNMEMLGGGQRGDSSSSYSDPEPRPGQEGEDVPF